MIFHDSFHIGVRQIIPKLISHKILDVYLHINVMNKSMFSLVLTAVTKAVIDIVTILDDLIVFLYWC